MPEVEIEMPEYRVTLGMEVLVNANGALDALFRATNVAWESVQSKEDFGRVFKVVTIEETEMEDPDEDEDDEDGDDDAPDDMPRKPKKPAKMKR